MISDTSQHEFHSGGQNLFQWWSETQRRLDIPGLTLLSVTFMTMGIFAVSHDTLVVALLLVVPILVLAWVRSVWTGIPAALVAGLLTCPYFTDTASVLQLAPSLDMRFWVSLVVCYIALAVMVSIHGQRHRELERAAMSDIQEKLVQAQASAEHYEALFGELSQGQERLKRMNEELALLNIIATVVNSSLDVAKVQEAAVSHLGSLLDVDEVYIYWYNTHADTFTLYSAHGMTTDEIAQCPPVPATEGFFARTMISPRALTISQVTGDLYLRPPYMSKKVRSVLGLPLRSGMRLMGVLAMGRASGVPFTEDDERFLESLGRILSVAIENATLYKQAQELSLSDELTGLANRRMFNLRLDSETSRIKTSGSPLCLVIFDLDFFKRVNDTYGHHAGDEVLCQFARRVQQDIRTTDLLCRLGGEEFALVAPDTPLPVTVAIAERICRMIAQTPFILEDGTAVSITISAGVANFCVPMQCVEELIAAADQSLYAAKAAGRNQVQVYHYSESLLEVV